MNDLSLFQQLLQQYEQWLEEYSTYHPTQQSALKHKYQNIQAIIIRFQELPDNSNLKDPAFAQAAQNFWQMVLCVQALLLEEL